MLERTGKKSIFQTMSVLYSNVYKPVAKLWVGNGPPTFSCGPPNEKLVNECNLLNDNYNKLLFHYTFIYLF